ncbi:MAG: Gamma-glutamyltranspeptidase @ Glutathione hydrolase [uncultured Nocardioidaceae bacterium]|uniref:Gamma-glutamyltranspeptidase @ Glutathione hydrolase n=1 Tax=uncultured Nocardioidaceae bacterium TaxID=253824 RepID=A0A6J4MJI4_9ACTN|nr:MAG: Gamma-glutamyltranspeptidase @ Glutathione hydrolase [uncultured Nocardioidaceae bacterium]
MAVAAPNDLAVQAGVGTAVDGGNAVDAAIAAALTTMVTEPGLVSLTAGGYVTVQPHDSGPVTVDGGVEMPGRGLPRERLGQGVWDVDTPYAGGTRMTIGPGSVATPGALKALELAWRTHGSLPWRRLLEPAVEAAAGFAHGSASYYYLSYVHEQVFGWQAETRAALLGPDGALVPTGGRVVVPHLADTVRQLAEEGSDALYRGDLGAALADHLAGAGGVLTRGDLAAYQAVVREPLVVTTGGWELATNPPPAAGGVAVAALVALLDGVPRGGTWTPDELRLLARAQACVFGAGLADPPDEDGRTARAGALLQQVRDAGRAALTSPSTATVSVVDDRGGACAVTVSSGYGSGVTVPGTGLALNNCLGEQELLASGPHSLPPGTRLTSNMAPTVGRRTADGAVLALGSPGSDRIPTALAQVLALLTAGVDLHSAIAAPRLHVRVRPQDDPPVLLDHEEDLVLPADTGLPTRSMPAHSMYFGGVAGALWDPAVGLLASGDPRRAGAVAVHTG